MRKELAKLRKEVLASVRQSEDRKTDSDRLLDDIRESGPSSYYDSPPKKKKSQKEEEE